MKFSNFDIICSYYRISEPEFYGDLVYKFKKIRGMNDLSESIPEFYGDLVYKFKKNRGMTDFSDQFRKIIMRYKRIGYNLNVM